MWWIRIRGKVTVRRRGEICELVFCVNWDMHARALVSMCEIVMSVDRGVDGELVSDLTTF